MHSSSRGLGCCALLFLVLTSRMLITQSFAGSCVWSDGFRHRVRKLSCSSLPTSGETESTRSSVAPSTTCDPSRLRLRTCLLKPENEEFAQVAMDVARCLNIPVLSMETCIDWVEDVDHALIVQKFDGGTKANDYAFAIQPVTSADRQKLRKRRAPDPLSSSFAMKPLLIDFCEKLSEQPSARSGRDLLVRAVAPRKGRDGASGATVVDLTAGFAQDALVLARAGARRVTLVERDPIVHVLLKDASRRLQEFALNNPIDAKRKIAGELHEKLHLVHGEGSVVSRTLVDTVQDPRDLPDVVYIDQMFPPRTKQALVKKDMQILHGLLQSQEEDMEALTLEGSALLDAAFSLAQGRVVCKRPLNAPPLGLIGDSHCQPSYEIRGTISRWDVYLI